MQYLILIDKLWAPLSEDNFRKNPRIKPILDCESSLQIIFFIDIKLFQQLILRPALCEWKIFLVCKKAKVLSDNIIEIINHSWNSFNFIRIYFWKLFFFFFFRVFIFSFLIFLFIFIQLWILIICLFHLINFHLFHNLLILLFMTFYDTQLSF